MSRLKCKLPGIAFPTFQEYQIQEHLNTTQEQSNLISSVVSQYRECSAKRVILLTLFLFWRVSVAFPFTFSFPLSSGGVFGAGVGVDVRSPSAWA